MSQRRSIGVLLLAAGAAYAPSALSQPTLEEHYFADKRYQEGRWLLRVGRVDEACRKLEESERLEARVGTLIELAKCHQREGKTATAWREINEARDRAAREPPFRRAWFEQQIDPIRADIEPRVSRLTITLAPGDPEAKLELTLDEAPIEASSTPVPIDPGEHTIEATASGRKRFSTVVVIGDRADTKTVVVPVLERLEPAPRKKGAARAVRVIHQEHAEDAPRAAIGASTALLWQDDEENRTGATIIGVVRASYSITGAVAPFVRLGYAVDLPAAGNGVATFANPVAGVSFGVPFGDHFEAGLVLGGSIPVGTGGGDDADPAAVRANYAASEWAGYNFLVNYVDASAELSGTLTVDQFSVELTAGLDYLFRVRGENADPDPRISFLTSGVGVHYAITPHLSLFAEYLYVVLLSTPEYLRADPSARDYHIPYVGISSEIELGKTTSLSPSLLYAHWLDDPKRSQDANLVELDLELQF